MALRLEDIELIQQLKHRYFRFLDTGNTEGLRGLFTPDATTAYVGSDYRIECKGPDEIAKFLTFPPETVGCHTGHQPEIDVQSDDYAEGMWVLTDMFIDFRKNTILHGAGVYRDRYRKIDGQWKIAHTGYTRLYEREEPLTKKPNLTAHLLAAKKQAA